MAERIEGEVDYFNDVGRYGFIVPEADGGPDKDVFFSMEDIDGPDLEEGDVVQFEYKMAERGPRATDVYRDGVGAASADGEEEDDDDSDDTDTAVYSGTDAGDPVDLSTDQYRELRERMIDVFGGAEFPISNPMELVPALPEGPDTSFDYAGFSMTVVELTSALDDDNYPYDDVESFVDDAFAQLDAGEEITLPASIETDGAESSADADDGESGESGAESGPDDAEPTTGAVDDADDMDDADDDETNVYDAGAAADAGDDPSEDWDPVYRFCSSCGTDLRKYGRITAGNFCPACGSLIGE